MAQQTQVYHRVASGEAHADAARAFGRLQRDLAHAPRQASVVECRFFGGMSIDDTAAALDISPRTVKRDWTFARAWLQSAMRATVGDPD